MLSMKLILKTLSALISPGELCKWPILIENSFMRQVLKLKKKTEKEKQKLAMQSISFKDWVVC